jgi:nucleoside-diphosphate-sugar epimerase
MIVLGVCAVAHVASNMSFDPNPYNVIPSVVAGAVNVLNAALAEPSVKRFIYTSSSTAAVLSSQSSPGVVVTQDTWNEASVQEAWAEPPYGPQRSSAVYAASKTAAEKEIWRCYREFPFRRRDFVLNTGVSVLPFSHCGDTNSSSITQCQFWPKSQHRSAGAS